MNQQELLQIIETARFAPSVHNTQPWKVSTDGQNIFVNIDNNIDMAHSDPTGRETMISLGIFCEAIKLAAEANGFTAESISVKDGHATLAVNKLPEAAANQEQLKYLKTRSTDRSVYKPAEISQDFKQALQNTSVGQNTEVQVVTDQAHLETIADLTSRGIRLALSNPLFRKELSNYIVWPWFGKNRGIAVNTLAIPMFIALFEPLLMKLGIGQNAEAPIEKKRWQSASAVAVILGSGDTENYWFEAGRTYLQTSLEIEKAGLAQATSAAIVEASDYHEDLEQILGTNKRVLALIRIGKGVKKRPYSPRVKAQDLITT